MQLRHLKYFVTLGQEAHFGRAADVCNVTQSTLSAAIRQLEVEIGAPLIERDKRFKGFTAEGRVLLDWAKRVVSERDALDQQIGLMRGELAGELRIGVIPTTLPTIGLFTTPLSRVHPKVTLKILSHTSNEIQRALDEFRLDVGVTYLDNEPMHGVDMHPLYDENYILLTPADGPFKGRQDVTWKEAAYTPLCLLTPDMQNRRIIDGIFRSVGKAPVAALETNSIFNLCSHAASGRWSSIVPRPLLYFFGVPRNTRHLRLVEPEASRTMGLIIADREPASPLARGLFSLVQPLEPGDVLTPPGEFATEFQ